MKTKVIVFVLVKSTQKGVTVRFVRERIAPFPIHVQGREYQPSAVNLARLQAALNRRNFRPLPPRLRPEGISLAYQAPWAG